MGAFVADPAMRPRSARNQRRLDEADDLAEAYGREPAEAIAAAAIEAVDCLAKGIERSRNLKGDIQGSFWRAITKLTAAVTVLGRRAGAPQSAATSPGVGVSEAGKIRRLKEASRLREDRRRLREEIVALEARQSLARVEGADGVSRPVDSLD